VAAVVAWVMYRDPTVGVLLAIAMVFNLFVAGMAGTLIPLGLKALKFDPALVSTVFITTFTDVCGFASFLGLATLFTRYFPRAG
jgi:magnesium transporter